MSPIYIAAALMTRAGPSVVPVGYGEKKLNKHKKVREEESKDLTVNFYFVSPTEYKSLRRGKFPPSRTLNYF